MAKQSGVGNTRAYVHGYDISGDVSVINNAGYADQLLEVPTLTKSAAERLRGLTDGQVSFNAWFDPDSAADHQHDAWLASGSLPTTDRVVLVALGSAVGDPCVFLEAKQANYNVNRTPGSAIEGTAEFMPNDNGVEFGVMLNAHDDTIASSGNGTSVDLVDVTTTNGASTVLEVMSVASGTVDVDIQDSADDAAFLDITGLSFTAATAKTAERLETAAGATIRRYIRAEYSNTFTNAVVAIGFMRG